MAWILDGTSRMDALITELLAYCSVDAAPAPVPVPLDGALAGALDQLAGEVSARDAVVQVEPLPVVAFDPVQAGQLLRNLLSNALKFVPPGTAPVIRVSAQRTPDGWTVTVADNGIGIEEAQRERIFSMFERIHGRERYDGTGIGLSICRRIVERRGGAVWVEPGATGGSRFRFSVPDIPPPCRPVQEASS